ncbi:hypothetical protein ACWDSJ_00530 [Nocardia sp. NPDC003482]
MEEPVDIMPEAGPAAAGVIGAAAVHAADDVPPAHSDEHRMPRIRVRFTGDRDRMGRKYEGRRETSGADPGKDQNVPPTIGE